MQKHTVKEVRLKNGMRGLFVDVPRVSVMTFDFQMNAGDYLCSLEKVETAHLMEHMLFQANEQFSRGRDFQAELERNGAMFNASTGTYSVNYYAECADFEWDRVLPLLGLAITRPVFKQIEFDAEFGNVKEELNMLLNNHFRQLSLRLSEEMGFFVQNENRRLRLMGNVNRRDIRDHYNKTHFADNTRFIIAGNLRGRGEQIKRILNRDFKLPKGERISLPKEEPISLDKALIVKRKAVDNLYFAIETYHSNDLSEEERRALGIFNIMLNDTMDSKILGEARERGLAYHVSSGVTHHPSNSGFWMGSQIQHENAQALFEIIFREIDKVLQGKVYKKDIEAAKQYQLGSFQRAAQTVGSLSRGYSSAYFSFDEIAKYHEFTDQIKKIDKQAVIDVARKMYEQKRFGVGFLGNIERENAESLRSQLLPLWS